jgi:hypothetical protein
LELYYVDIQILEADFCNEKTNYPGVHTRRQIPFWEEERKDKSELTVMSQTQFHTWSRG